MLTRRDFMKLVGAGAAALLLGCSSREVSSPPSKVEKTVQSHQESNYPTSECPEGPYCNRYEKGWPKFKKGLEAYGFGLPDFPAYRLKCGNWAYDEHGNKIPPEEIEKKKDEIWYSYDRYRYKTISAFEWDGVILDLTDAVNENPYVHPWYPGHEKYWNAIRCILFPRDEKSLENTEVKKVKWKFDKDDRVWWRYYMLDEIDDTPVKGHIWFQGFARYDLILPLTYVSVSGLENNIYRKIKENVEKQLVVHGDEDVRALIGGVSGLWFLDRSGNGVIANAIAGQLRIIRPKAFYIDERETNVRPAAVMYFKTVDKIKEAFKC